MRRNIILILYIITILNFSLFAEVSVTVEKAKGGPQIFVDGNPVRPRMFWGIDRGGKVLATDQWKEFSFDITSSFDANATWHFRFGNEPGEVWLTDVKITNSETGRIVFPGNTFKNINNFNNLWNIYPPDENNTVGNIEVTDSAVHVTLTNPPVGELWPNFHIYSDYVKIPTDKTYSFSCKVKAIPDRSISPQVYHVKDGWTYIGGPPSIFQEEVLMAKDVGINFITFNTSNCWLSPEKDEDWQPLDFAIQQILKINPHALIIPRISMDAPSWWKSKYPDALMVYEDGSKGTKVPVSNRQYRYDAANHLEKLCSHLREKFPDNLAGIHPSGQNTGEWFYDKTWESRLSGYDAATLEAWQSYSDGTSEIPSAISRRPANERMLLDPVIDNNVINFNRFLQDEMADFILTLAAAARRGLGQDKLVMFFYGYHYEFGTVWNSPAISGHYALSKVLESSDIDILCAPISYHDRKLTGSGPAMSSVESVALAGKMWLNEDDTRTYLNTNLEDGARYGGLNNLEQTQAVLLRNATQSAIRGFGTWWMDHGAGTGGGWFADAELWKVMDQVKELDNQMFSRNDYYMPEIALIVDENSMLYLAGGSTTIGRELLYISRSYFARTGTTYGQYMMEDAVNGNIPSKFKVFLAAWALNEENRTKLIQNRKKDETRVWCYAPGYITSEGNSLDAMRELTGFEFQKIDINSAIVTPTEKGIQYGINNPWGIDQKITPLFTVNPDSCIVLANYENGQTAVAIKEGKNGKDIFVGTPQLTTEVIRALTMMTSIKFFSEENLNVWSGEKFFAFHSIEDGIVNLNINNDHYNIVDAISGEEFGSNPDISMEVKAGETRLLTWYNTSESEQENITEEFQLKQNYPNPFNPITTIEYSIPQKAFVNVDIYDLSGKKIESVVKQEQKSGNYKKVWNASGYSSGIYILRIQTNNNLISKKMLLIK